jgi:hypothetical protein
MPRTTCDFGTYREMSTTCSYKDSTCPLMPPLPAQLSDLNKLRLLTGYHSLILSWTRISTTPLPLVGSCGMGTANHQEYCVSQWDGLWSAPLHAISPSASVRGDLVKNMEALQSCRASTCPVAINVATRGLPKLVKTIKASMADHFLSKLGIFFSYFFGALGLT